MLLVWSSGPLQEPVPKQTAGETIEPRENDQGREMVSAYQSPANILPGPGVLSPYAGTGTPAAAPPLAMARLREQPGAPQRARRRVFWSSHHPAARKQSRGKPSTKQRTPKGRKPHPFSLGQLPEKQATNAPAKCSPPDNSQGVLDNTMSSLPSTFTLLDAHTDKAPLVMVYMAGVKARLKILAQLFLFSGGSHQKRQRD
ncbi:hypothetical protein MTO96_052226 [Rhipicephalus appendiculatus]